MSGKPNQLPPFAPVDLRVWMEGDEAMKNVVGSIRLLQWLEGPDAELPLELIAAAMGMSERHARRHLDKAEARGWVVRKRAARNRMGRGAYTYALAIQPMAFKDARTSLYLAAKLATRSDGPTGQIELTYRTNLVNLPANLAGTNIQKKDLRERLRERARARKASPSRSTPACWTMIAAEYQSVGICAPTETKTNLRAAAALEPLGQVLAPTLRAYLADHSRRLEENNHPLAWLVETIDSYRPTIQRKSAPKARHCKRCGGSGKTCVGLSIERVTCPDCGGSGEASHA